MHQAVLRQIPDGEVRWLDDVAAVGLFQAGQHLQQGRLAGAVGAAQRHALTIVDLPGHRVEQHALAEGLGEGGELDHCRLQMLTIADWGLRRLDDDLRPSATFRACLACLAVAAKRRRRALAHTHGVRGRIRTLQTLDCTTQIRAGPARGGSRIGGYWPNCPLLSVPGWVSCRCGWRGEPLALSRRHDSSRTCCIGARCRRYRRTGAGRQRQVRRCSSRRKWCGPAASLQSRRRYRSTAAPRGNPCRSATRVLHNLTSPHTGHTSAAPASPTSVTIQF